MGLAADIGTLQRFPKIVGNDSVARELALTARVFDAREAERIGFISRTVGGGQGGVLGEWSDRKEDDHGGNHNVKLIDATWMWLNHSSVPSRPALSTQLLRWTRPRKSQASLRLRSSAPRC